MPAKIHLTEDINYRLKIKKTATLGDIILLLNEVYIHVDKFSVPNEILNNPNFEIKEDKADRVHV